MEDFEGTLFVRRRCHESSRRILIRELDGLQGRPDLVDAKIQVIPFAVDLGVLAPILRSPAKARLLSALRYGSPRTLTYLERVTGLSSRSLGEHIRHLGQAGIVEFNNSSAVSLCIPLPWSMVEITSYEGKMSNWRRALQQAIGYRSFSNSVRVVMPVSGALHARRQVPTVFHSNGIGLIAVDNDGNPHVEIRSKKRRPSSRRLYLMAVGAVLNEFLDKKGAV